jgi:predicted  nucleic acid-binding Zn-ribbon protein
MAEVTQGARLHDRATRGESLTDAERATLERWYQDGDEAEAALLAAQRPIASQDAAPSDLSSALAMIRETVASIETIHQQNATLREEIAALQQRLTVRAA